MTTLQIGNHNLNTEEIIPLLASYKLIPQLLCESIIDHVISPVKCTEEEIAQAYQQFAQHWELNSEVENQAWREQYGMNQEQLESLVTRRLRVEKFKQVTWGDQLESYFLKRKSQLDRVIYSLIQTKDSGIANELYFRLQEKEQSFAELARIYSEGSEAATGGLIGPTELGVLHPSIARLLYICQAEVGVVQPPICLGEVYLIIRLEKFIPAQLNNAMRQRLLQENFEAWFQQQLNQLPYRDQIWMGVPTNRQVTS